MKVLLSAYGCEPDQGSEPGVGWRWANGLADRVDLTVLTRRGNREVIERAREQAPADDPIREVEFRYYDLPKWVLFLKKRGILPIMPYYILWQLAVYCKFRWRVEEFDIVHHLTFCSLLCPGFWSGIKPGFVIGPVGAPLVNEHYIPLFGRSAWLQRVRGMVIRNFDRLPWLKRVYAEAGVIVPANSDTKTLIEGCGFDCADVILDTGAPEVEVSPRSPGAEGVRIMYGGALFRRKGLELSLKALAGVGDGAVDWRFNVVGDGPDRERLEGMVKELGIAERVNFMGRKTQEETWAEMGRSDFFLFTSVRDTSAGVNLEAMACGLPIVCLGHQGVADIVTDDCAIRVSPGTIEESVDGLAEAITRMATEDELRESMGRQAVERANKAFAWEEKFEQMTAHYARLLDAERGVRS